MFDEQTAQGRSDQTSRADAPDPLADDPPRFTIIEPGALSTVQHWPGRPGCASVGVPPSGPMDDLSFLLGNRALGNDEGVAGLEITGSGPTLRFLADAVIMVTGAPAAVLVDSHPVPQWDPLSVPAGAVVEIGAPSAGARTYVLIRGGIDARTQVGSATALPFDQIGVLTGRPLQGGDIVTMAGGTGRPRGVASVPISLRPTIQRHWRIGVLEGPHGAPDFVTTEDVEAFFAASWAVHVDPTRSGVRLVGPKPSWARRDGGDAGLHPSTIHDTPYAVGAVSYVGDLPVLNGPDGPTLGGSLSPATVITAHRWKLGQLRAGDRVEFVPVGELQADDLRRRPQRDFVAGRAEVVDGGVLLRLGATAWRPRVTFRRSGDDNLLVEYGEMILDLGLRVRVHALAEAISRQVDSGGLIGVVDVTPGVRSLQLHVDPAQVRVGDLLGVVRALDDALPPTRELTVASRTVRLPLSWQDPAIRDAIARDRGDGRDEKPWCPGTLDFLRRINGLDTVDQVADLIFQAEYLVLGLGAGSPGAPLATAIDPRHRLVTTTYDPARTWTPRGAVGIGGSYLGIHSLDGPGTCQLIGRTVPIWGASGPGGSVATEDAGLLRCFDRISWYPVEPAELVAIQVAVAAGEQQLSITDGTFSMADHDSFLEQNTEAIAEFVHTQSSAFGDERRAWQRTGAHR